MREINLDIRVIFYREHDQWVAHCLEFDLIGSGDSKDAAFASLETAIKMQVGYSLEHNNPQNLFRPANSEVFHRYAVGQELDCASLSRNVGLKIKIVDIPHVITREYVEDTDHVAMA